ncbi:hypothetical protein [Halorussus halobius]|uniref:hypothetical protein n=1 Tax=Halorussus halobius TaxID=1710537 RepID=UPI001091B629|nr:hypothetical protein [Halorussus halobius]
MNPFRSHFGDDDSDEADGLFDDDDEFVPDHLPVPGPFLQGHDVLDGEDHVAFHETTRELFEERGVYDMTFDYNLARLNLDTRHERAGYRYAEADGDDPEATGDLAAGFDDLTEDDDPSVLRAEFTPTTPFCPQTHTLTVGSFRAWNGLADRHDYDLVRVRAAEMHHDSGTINRQLADLEATYLETGDLSANPNRSAGGASDPAASGNSNADPPERGPSRGSQAPF